MASLENLLESAVKDGTTSGIVVFAKDKDGKVDIAKAFSPENGTPYNLDSVMEIASMTKFPTSVAALQIVEKGLITLDEDLSHLLPTLAEQGILISVADDGTPTTRKRQNPITLRRLLSHSSGAGYYFLDAGLGKIRATQKAPRHTVDEAFGLPLLFEPGEGWAYSPSLDWAGLLVEKLTGLTLDEYMVKNIWEPLGAHSSTFFPDQHPDIKARQVPMAYRDDPDGPAVEKPDVKTIISGYKHCFGGQGLLSSMEDCFKLVYSLLVDDEKVLKKETTALLFTPQLTSASKESMHKFMETPAMKVMFPSPVGVDRDHSLGGLLIAGDGHEYWREGTVMWGGAANLNWFIDRAAGVCGVFGTQLLLPSDPRMRSLINAFQKDVYRRAGKLE
ncbi:beta-lactamase family protein [Hypoxylon trugodes]|uniref:beta-lactamase family protein n=1 Tax=Hypoxylon trugodes TaxID=326681 RepID=UPI00219B5CBE|nr:beta-lactamase family protein [Hypoxylon trugodes]KAI1390538.1 beta-lactamase family protein [Hypoxylon trugodes]